jgi:hypothetical protein
MQFSFERRDSASARWSRRVANFAVVLLLTAVAGHRYGAVDTPPFFWVVCLVGALAVLAILLAAFGFFRLWTNGDRGGRAATRAVLLALLVLLPFGYAGFQVYSLPWLTQVSTDTVRPPQFLMAPLTRTPDMLPIGPMTPQEVVLQAAAYPAVTGRRYTQPVDRLDEIIGIVMDQLGWEVAYHIAPQAETIENEMEASARSPILGLVSDIVIRITDEGESTYVDVRSVSRYGPHDLGDNAAKVLRFFEALDAEVMLRNMPINVEED